MFIINQDKTHAINTDNYDWIGVEGRHICASRNRDNKASSFILGDYKTEAEAKETFEAMMNDLSERNAFPFADSSFSPYWMP